MGVSMMRQFLLRRTRHPLTLGPITGTPDGPMEALITPAVITQRSSYSFSKLGVIQPVPTWMLAGNGVYWGDQCLAPCAAYPDRRFNYFSTDHDDAVNGSTGSGGIGITVCVGDPSELVNWKTYADAVTAGWLNDIASKPSSGPIFSGFVSSNQVETPCVNKVGDDFVLTYQAGTVPGARNQATQVAVSPNGVTDWVGTNTPLMQVAESEAMGDGHMGYMKWGPNPFPRGKVPFDYVGYSLVGGQSRSSQGMWGSDAPATSWTFIRSIGKASGRVTPSSRFQTNSDRFKLAMTNIDVKAIRATRQGYTTVGEFAGVGSGSTAKPGDLYEVLLADDGYTIIGKPQKIVSRGTTGTYDNGEVAPGSMLTFADKSIMVYNAATSANVKTDALAVSPLRNPLNTWFVTPSPTLPPESRMTIKDFDFTSLVAIPAGMTVVTAGTTTPVPTFSANGMDVTVDGTEATKGEFYLFDDTGFNPLTTEFVDILIDDWSTVSSTAYRVPYVGFATSKSLRSAMPDSLFVSNGEGADGTLSFTKTAETGLPTFSTGVSEDYWGVGYGPSGSIGTTALPKKMVGVRIYPMTNVAYILGEGGVEQQEFRVSDENLMNNFDKTKTWYPFIGFRGTEVAPATERVGKLRIRVAAHTAPEVGAASFGPIVTTASLSNATSYNSGNFDIGAAVATRRVAIFLSGRSASQLSTLTATFTPAGQSAITMTRAYLHQSQFDLPSSTFMALFVADIPVGTYGAFNATSGNTILRWGMKAMTLFGTADKTPNEINAVSIVGNTPIVETEITKVAGSLVAMTMLNSSSSSTLHSHAAEEVRYDVPSAEVIACPVGTVITQYGIRNQSAATLEENTGSTGAVMMVARWNKA